MSAETVQDGWVPTEDFAARLLLARRHAGLTVRDAAAAAGIHYATWSTWERGARPANMAAEVEKISNALGVDRNWLMWGSPKPWDARQNEAARTPRGARATGQLPRLDSNQQPADQRRMQVIAAFRTQLGSRRPGYPDHQPAHDRILHSVDGTAATQVNASPTFDGTCVEADRSVA